MIDTVTVDRHKYIGGSDIPVIMGLSPFKTRWQLLQEKAGIAESTFTGNKYTDYGNEMEDKIRQHINKLYGTVFEPTTVINGKYRCNVDGFDGSIVLEIKTTSGKINQKVYEVQLLHYMQQLRAGGGVLAVYIRPGDFDTTFDPARLTTYNFIVSDHADTLLEIHQAVNRFIQDLEILKANPELTEQDLMIPTELIQVVDKIQALETRLLEMDIIKTSFENLKAELKEKMEEYNIKKWTTPNGTQITLVEDGQDKEITKFNEGIFKEDNPELYDKYLEPSIRKGRKGYVRITYPKG